MRPESILFLFTEVNMAYYCLCDCDDYSYTILLLDYLIKMGNLVGLVYFIAQSDFFTNLFKSDEKKWTKIVKNNDDYSIITSDDEEYQDEKDEKDEKDEQNEQNEQNEQDRQDEQDTQEEDEKQKTD
jgi:hypothetical protein